jgi:CelD/BcsL family acetyltransferase involved in cellulose biosynthesis
VRIEAVDSPAVFRSLEGEWNGLLRRSRADCLFLTWEWLHTWWTHLAEDRRLAVLLVRREGELVGIAPFARRARRLLGWLGAPCLELLGTGSVGSDYLDVIAGRDEEAEVASALADHLDAHEGMLDLRQLRAAEASLAGLQALLGGRGWAARSSQTAVCPYIDLRGHTWDSYLGSLGREHRYGYRRKLRALEKRYALRFERVTNEAERRQALLALVSLHQRRWDTRGGSDGLHTAALVAFHEELSRIALERGWLRLFILRLDGRPAAALYGFRYGEVFYFYQSGFDPRDSKEGVGVVCMGLAIESAITEGVREYDLLHGDEAYKFHWAAEVRKLERVELFPPRLMGRLWNTVVGLDREARRAARRLLPSALMARFDAARRQREMRRPHASATR